jgi:hypothetical protein
MKGVTGYQLAVIISIIIAIVIIALYLIFQDIFIEGITKMFGKFVQSFLDVIRGILGPWGSIIMPGL